MQTLLHAIAVAFVLSSIASLCGCNTSQGLSQDVNHFSDSVHRAVNS